MRHFSLFLLVGVVLAVTPLATAGHIRCIGNGIYTANSTYEANLRRLAAILPAEISSSQGHYANRAVGYWPNRLEATAVASRCARDGCAACIAAAFQEAEKACPYSKKVFVYGRNCSLILNDFTIFRSTNSVLFGSGWRYTMVTGIDESMATGIVLQVIGFACLFFLLLQEWRDRKRGSMMDGRKAGPTPMYST